MIIDGNRDRPLLFSAALEQRGHGDGQRQRREIWWEEERTAGEEDGEGGGCQVSSVTRGPDRLCVPHRSFPMVYPNFRPDSRPRGNLVVGYLRIRQAPATLVHVVRVGLEVPERLSRVVLWLREG